VSQQTAKGLFSKEITTWTFQKTSYNYGVAVKETVKKRNQRGFRGGNRKRRAKLREHETPTKKNTAEKRWFSYHRSASKGRNKGLQRPR